MSSNTPLHAFLGQVRNKPQEIYLNQPANGHWSSYTWKDVEEQARTVAQALLSQGLVAGDRVAILSRNCAQWVVADLAIMMAHMISVPIYSTAGRETIEHILSHSGAKAIFIGGVEDGDIASAAVNRSLVRVGFPSATLVTDHSWDHWLEFYNPISSIDIPQRESIATIVYTSGSTGLPKGVALSHGNLAAAGRCVSSRVSVQDEERCLSYLPLAHITERGVVEMGSFETGIELYFSEAQETFLRDIQKARPTVFISVPRLWTIFQSQVLAKIPQKTLDGLLNNSEMRDEVIFGIRQQLGFSETRHFASGSAPNSPHTLDWFAKLNIEIADCWGMTETCGLACANFPYESSARGTIGKPVEGVEMKLSEDGEILVRGDTLFSEYYRNPEATEQAFQDGWFKTGDRGEITKEGNFRIIGRAKEQFKTAKGKYVMPAEIEDLLLGNAEIEQVCVIGHGRKQPIAVVVLRDNPSAESEDIETFRTSLANIIKITNGALESHKKLDHMVVTTTPWTAANNLLTPTLKIRRNKVEELYKHLLTADLHGTVCWEHELNDGELNEAHQQSSHDG